MPPEPLSAGIEGLAEGIRQFTDIIPGKRIPVFLLRNSPFRYPFLYISTGKRWEYLPREAEILGEYLRNGGFALLDNLSPWEEFSPAETSLRQFIRDALGAGARFEPIPNDDPVYHCYYDFPDGPPVGSELRSLEESQSAVMNRSLSFLEGVRLHGRLVAVLSNKGYGNIWLRRGNNEPQLKMGVNLVVYALRQQGGYAVRYIDENLAPGRMVKRNSVAGFPESGSPRRLPRGER